MKRINRLCAIASIATALAGTSSYAAYQFDGSVTLGYGTYNGNGGGTFSAATTGIAKPGLGNFLTFCLEENEYFVPGGTYSYNISGAAVNGGVNLSGNPGGNPDPISIGTAWLYSQFRKGLIPVASNQDAIDLQLAIWFLEGEKNQNPLSLTAGATTLLNNAVAALPATDYDGLKLNSGGEYGVVALNIYSKTPPVVGAQSKVFDGETWYVVQDQLAIVPEASTVIAGALLLLPFGASAIRILRKNRAA